MKGLRVLACLVLLGLAAPSGEVAAAELWSHGETSLDLSGSLREVANLGSQTSSEAFARAATPGCLFAVTFPDCPSFGTVGEKDAWQSLTRLRVRADLQIIDALRAVVIFDNELQTGVLDTFEAELGRSFRQDDLVDAEWTVVDDDHVSWRSLFYRGYLQLTTGPLDLSVGRQRIAWGVGRLWNPIDRFNAIPPLALQSDQTQGIDSVDARWSFDGFDFAEAVVAPGSGAKTARYALRLHGVWLDTDLSLMGGLFEKAPTVGFDFARNVGDAALRAEVVYTDPEQKVWKVGWSGPRELDDFVQAVVSLDYTLDLADGIYLLVEHLYNGNDLGFGRGRAGPLLPFFEATDTPPPGVPDGLPGPFVTGASAAVFGSSRVISAAANQTGFLAGGDITPELRLDLLTIYDWEGESAAFFPSLSYSPGGSLELTVGVQTFVGPRRSQYGDADTFAYLLADFFF